MAGSLEDYVRVKRQEAVPTRGSTHVVRVRSSLVLSSSRIDYTRRHIGYKETAILQIEGILRKTGWKRWDFE